MPCFPCTLDKERHMDPEPVNGESKQNLGGDIPAWSAERMEALTGKLTVTDIQQPKWAGISPQDTDNLNFACTSQLLKEYSNCLNYGVSAGTIKARHNSSYQGETSEDGRPNGHGTVQLFGGLAYTGAFKGGLLHGEGTLQWENGLLSYTGGFCYNSIHGRGTYRWPGGAYYTGQVFQGLPHGEGCMYTGEDDFCTYKGFWKHGLRHGQGKLAYGKDGKYVYEGYWARDRKQGEGHMTYGSGSKYRGHWLEGKRHGKGRLVLMTLHTSTKNTVANLGRLDSTRVHIYDGDWINDLPHGMVNGNITQRMGKVSSSMRMGMYVVVFLIMIAMI